MPKGRSKLRTANRTSLRRRTSRSGARDMTLRRRNDGAAHHTNLIFRTRCIGAKRMTFRGNTLRPFLVTTAARRSLYAFFHASGHFRLHIFAPIMTESGNFLLRLNDGVTAAAMDAFGFPRRRTRRRNCRVLHFSMAESFDIPRLRFPAAGTFRRLNAFHRASGSFCLHILAPIMSKSRDFFLCFDDGVTAAAMDAFGFPRSRTRCRDCRVLHFNMTESFDLPRLRFPAARAFGRLDTLFRASRRFRLRVFAPIMP